MQHNNAVSQNAEAIKAPKLSVIACTHHAKNSWIINQSRDTATHQILRGILTLRESDQLLPVGWL